MKPTNTFKTRIDYYREVSGRKRNFEKEYCTSDVVARARENVSESPCSIIEGLTYGLALKELRRSKAGIDPRHLITIDGQEYVRPLTFKETLEARLNAYKAGMTNEEKMFLLNQKLSTCTGIAYPAEGIKNSNTFKIIPVCKELITLYSGFPKSNFRVSYDSLEEEEVCIRIENYHPALMTKEKLKNHPGWLAAVENDKGLLSEYIDFLLISNDPNQIHFYHADFQNTPQLRALFVDSTSFDSTVSGDYGLDEKTSFIRIGKRKPNQ